ncbi:MAG: hypothetical protein KatS3mg129_3096 [Leptospiraceae bacterium]|nr:MAG: hypothetical protein KatS3mg129_3096 [Leptospiraceae bacterium]
MLTKEHWIHFNSISSTNQYLLESQLPHGTIITADTQTAGRGRYSRKWYDIPGSTFIFSIVLYYKEISHIQYLSLIVALAVIEAIYKMLKDIDLDDKQLFIKWPNDILLLRNNHIGKLAGILIETVYNYQQWKVVIGIGLNWKKTPLIEKKEIYKFAPISLFDENFDKKPIFFLDYLLEKLNEFSIEKPFDFLSYRDLIIKYHFLKNKKIKIGGEEYIIQQIDNNGYLQLQNKNNQIITINDWNEEIEIL